MSRGRTKRRRSGSALGSAIILLGLVTLLSLPLLQQVAEWRAAYQQLERSETKRLDEAYRDWLKATPTATRQP